MGKFAGRRETQYSSFLGRMLLYYKGYGSPKRKRRESALSLTRHCAHRTGGASGALTALCWALSAAVCSVLLFVGFVLLCVLTYMRLEHSALRGCPLLGHPFPCDRLRHARKATKYFALVVGLGIFAFEICCRTHHLTFVGHRAGRSGNPC